jgi:hypothetical protein
MSGEPSSSADEATRPGPAWGRAVPFVAVLVALVTIVGTLIDVHILDGEPPSQSVSARSHVSARPPPRVLEQQQAATRAALGDPDERGCPRNSVRQVASGRATGTGVSASASLSPTFAKCRVPFVADTDTTAVTSGRFR